MKAILLSLIIVMSLFGQEFVELKLPNSNKIVIKFMFRNGSITDPVGKEGLTEATASVISQGGTGALTYSQIQDKIYHMAAFYGASTDKEVSIFTFEVHKDWLKEFYPIMIGLMTNPAFKDEDFQRVISSQQNYVDQVIRASSDEEYSKKSLEDLLFRGTQKYGAIPIIGGMDLDAEAQLAIMEKNHSAVIFGYARCIFRMSNILDKSHELANLGVKALFLAGEYVATAMRNELSRIWNCRIYTHYGLTEMGLGVAVECAAGDGYHFNEADLLLELIDPATGESVPPGS